MRDYGPAYLRDSEHMALPENLRAQLLASTDINELKTLVLIADAVIEELHEKLAYADDLIAALGEAVESNNQDARRYQLVKLILPTFMEIAAYAGTQGGEAAQEAFAQMDPLKLDAVLDIQLEAGVLEDLQDSLEEQAEAALDQQDDTYSPCGDPDCEVCGSQEA
jgi:hypothetical protein